MSPEPQHEQALHVPSFDRAGSSIASWIGRVGSVPRGKLIAILILLLTGIAAMYLVEPRIETSVGKPADPLREVLTPFLVSNGGFFRFRDVHLQCVARSVEFDETETSPKPDIQKNVKIGRDHV